MSADLDKIVARAYRHEVLDDRVVVVLTPESIASGTDLEMDVLGFGKPENRGEVSQEKKRPLGFPGWALVHDKKNARYALDVVRELNKQARKAKSKPGGAKDEIDKIAEKLGKTVPHFLPSFYEEVGRIFVGHGSPTYAAAFFGRAREAEAVHALDVDEQHRRDAFVEFALAGAVTTKALVQYAKELGEHHKPADAYAHFRQLCLQRTLGGMPPWAGMAKELRRLAKAAKLDPDAEDRALVAEIIESPALGKAAAEFWRAYDEPIAELAKTSKPARKALLDLFPTGSSVVAAKELDELWLDLVDRTGGFAALVADDPDVAPSGGRAAWFDKLCQHLTRTWRDNRFPARGFALLRALAPKLIADGAPIACTGRWNRLDLDLVELALELGIPVDAKAAHFDLDAWASGRELPERGRDPVRIAAHATLAKTLQMSVGQAIGNEGFDAASAGKSGFVAAKRAWLEDLVARAETKALPALEESLGLVNVKVKASLFADLPDLHARLAAIDVAPLLARTLRIGILDELGWPALEDAARELDPTPQPDKVGYTLHGGLPAVILATATKLIAVGPRGRLGTHDLVLPKGEELVTARFIQGQFFVIMKSTYLLRGYWSDAPKDVFPVEGNVYSMQAIAPHACLLADGAWQEGRSAIRAGDRAFGHGSFGGLSAFDGATAWIVEYKDGRSVLREVSASGEPGRLSWPQWLGDYADSEWKLDANGSYLQTAPVGLDSSPLGLKDGKLGARVRYKGATQYQITSRELESIDGATWNARADVHASDLLALPGDAARRPLFAAHQWNQGSTAYIVDPSGQHVGAAIRPNDRRGWAGSAWPYPPALIHALVPRDPEGSATLRAITDELARGLIGGATLPIANAALARGVAGHVKLAADLKELRDKLCKDRAPSTAGKQLVVADVDDNKLADALGFIADVEYGTALALAQIARTAEWFASTDRSDRATASEGSRLEWTALVARQGAIAWMATTRSAAEGERRAHLVALLRALAALPRENLRSYLAVGMPTFAGPERFKLVWHAGNAYAVVRSGWTGDRYRVLEYAPSGKLAAPPGQVMNLFHEVKVVPLDAAILDAVAGHTGHTWTEEWALALAAATGMTPSESRFLLAGMPSANGYGSNFLPKELREEIGLKAAQAQMARDSMKSISALKRVEVVDRAGRGAIGDIPALAAAWIDIVGARVPVSEELIADADKEVSAPLEPTQALAILAAADEAPELNEDAVFEVKDFQRVRRGGDEPPAFDTKILQTWCAYLPFVFGSLSVGDGLRAKLVTAHERVLARLTNKDLLLEAGTWYLGEDQRAGAEALVATVESLPALEIRRQTYGTKQEHLRVHVWVRPALLDAKAVPLVDKLVTAISAHGALAWSYLQLARGADFAAIVARVTDTPVPVGGWEQNPQASAAKLVDKVAKAMGLSKDAAALYLQYLVLLWPTPKNLARWNGWKPKQMTAAIAELVANDLVIEAKRERAQRAHFLPGGWEALKSPHPPLETWKLPMYGTRTAEGQVVATNYRFAAMAPFHLLFERAWKRIEAGDVPKYDEVKR